MADRTSVEQAISRLASALNIKGAAMQSYQKLASTYLGYTAGSVSELLADLDGVEKLIRDKVEALGMAAIARTTKTKAVPVKTPAIVSPPGSGKTAGIKAILDKLVGEGRVAKYMVYDMLKHNRTTSPISMIGVSREEPFRLADTIDFDTDQLALLFSQIAVYVADELVGLTGSGVDKVALAKHWHAILSALHINPVLRGVGYNDVYSFSSGPSIYGSILALCVLHNLEAFKGDSGYDIGRGILNALGRKVWDGLALPKQAVFGDGGDVVEFSDEITDKVVIQVVGGKGAGFVPEQQAADIAGQIVAALEAIQTLAGRTNDDMALSARRLSNVFHKLLSKGGALSRVRVRQSETEVETFSDDADLSLTEGRDEVERESYFAKYKRGSLEVLLGCMNPYLPLSMPEMDEASQGFAVRLPAQIMDFIREARVAYSAWRAGFEGAVRAEVSKEGIASVKSFQVQVADEQQKPPVYVLFMDEFFLLLSRQEATVITALWDGFLNRQDLFPPNMLIVLAGNAPEPEFFELLEPDAALSERALSPDQIEALYARLDLRFLIPSSDYIVGMLQPDTVSIAAKLDELEETADKPDLQAQKELRLTLSTAFEVGARQITKALSTMETPVDYGEILDFLASSNPAYAKKFVVLKAIARYLYDRDVAAARKLISRLPADSQAAANQLFDEIVAGWELGAKEGWHKLQSEYGAWGRTTLYRWAMEAYQHLSGACEFPLSVVAEARRAYDVIATTIIRRATTGELSEGLDEYDFVFNPTRSDRGIVMLAELLAYASLKVLSLAGVGHSSIKGYLSNMEGELSVPSVLEDAIPISDVALPAVFYPLSPRFIGIVSEYTDEGVSFSEEWQKLHNKLFALYQVALDSEALRSDVLRLFTLAPREFDIYVGATAESLGKYVAARYLNMYAVYGVGGSQKVVSGGNPLAQLSNLGQDFLLGFSLGDGTLLYGLYGQGDNGWEGLSGMSRGRVYPNYIVRFYGPMRPIEQVSSGSVSDIHGILQGLGYLYVKNRGSVLHTASATEGEGVRIEPVEFKAQLAATLQLDLSLGSTNLDKVIGRGLLSGDDMAKVEYLIDVIQSGRLFMLASKVASDKEVQLSASAHNMPRLFVEAAISDKDLGFAITDPDYPMYYSVMGKATENFSGTKAPKIEQVYSLFYTAISDVAKAMDKALGGLFSRCAEAWREGGQAVIAKEAFPKGSHFVGMLYYLASEGAGAMAAMDMTMYEGTTPFKAIRLLDVLAGIYMLLHGTNPDLAYNYLDELVIEYGGASDTELSDFIDNLLKSEAFTGAALRAIAGGGTVSWGDIDKALSSGEAKVYAYTPGLFSFGTGALSQAQQTADEESNTGLNDDVVAVMEKFYELVSRVVGLSYANFDYTGKISKHDEYDKMVFDFSPNARIAMSGYGPIAATDGRPILLAANNAQLFELSGDAKSMLAQINKAWGTNFTENDLVIYANKPSGTFSATPKSVLTKKGDQVMADSGKRTTPKIAGFEDGLDLGMLMYLDQTLHYDGWSSNKALHLSYIYAYFSMREAGLSLYYGDKADYGGRNTIIGAALALARGTISAASTQSRRFSLAAYYDGHSYNSVEGVDKQMTILSYGLQKYEGTVTVGQVEENEEEPIPSQPASSPQVPKQQEKAQPASAGKTQPASRGRRRVVRRSRK